ncbi:hypothetical protein INR49_013933, partial [Caranx melampygus]
MLLLILFAGCLASCAAQTTMAILQTAVQSRGQLNGTGTAQILNENLMQRLGQNVTFSLNIKNITE